MNEDHLGVCKGGFFVLKYLQTDCLHTCARHSPDPVPQESGGGTDFVNAKQASNDQLYNLQSIHPLTRPHRTDLTNTLLRVTAK